MEMGEGGDGLGNYDFLAIYELNTTCELFLSMIVGYQQLGAI